MSIQSFVCSGFCRRYDNCKDNQRWCRKNLFMTLISFILVNVLACIAILSYCNCMFWWYNNHNSSVNPTKTIIKKSTNIGKNHSINSIIKKFTYYQETNSSINYGRILRGANINLELLSEKEDILSASSSSESSWSFGSSSINSLTSTSAITSNSISFTVIGDAPYSSIQAIKLRNQILFNISQKESLFVTHVGDIRCAGRCRNPTCQLIEYTNVSSILRLSKVPVFILLGDNDWNDCPNHVDGLKYWKDTFLLYDTKFWDSTKVIGSTIRRQFGRTENYSYTINGTLFIGLNLVGGRVLDINEWNKRLSEQYNWVQFLIRLHVTTNTIPFHKRIVLFGHTLPRPNHDLFFIPLTKLIQNELKNTIPIVYIHGDLHKWQQESNFKNETSFLRISVVGEVQEYPLRVTINSISNSKNPIDVFTFRRSYY